MSLYNEILARKIYEEGIAAILENLIPEPEQTVEMVCYQALKQIRAILDDDSLSDPECFEQIEEIINVFEDIGSNGGSRHDFG